MSLKLTPLEFVFRSIPECFLIVMLAYIVYGKFIAKKSIIYATLVFAVSIYLIRLLPIMFGVHTILASLIFVIIGVSILNIPLNVSFLCIFISIISLSICEIINDFIIVNILKITGFHNIIFKIIYNTPSLIMFMIIVLLFYIFNKNIKNNHKKFFCIKH